MSTESQSDDEIIKNMVKLTCHDMDEATLYECELRESKNWINRFKNEYELALTNRDPRLLEVHNAVLDERNELVAHNDWKHFWFTVYGVSTLLKPQGGYCA